MSIKILVNGAFGRMGQMTTKAITDHPGFELVGQTGREYNLKDAIHDSHADIVIDFTHPDAVFANTKTIIEAGAHPVIGTTGLSLDQVHALQDECAKRKLGGLIAPNFSLGAVLMMKYAKEIVKHMPHVEIIEMHHEKKIDAPSGTAMRTAEMLAPSPAALTRPAGTLSHELERGKGDENSLARGTIYQGIHIHSIRLPGFLSQQDIIFGDAGETLTLKHISIDRECFMPGVCLACEKVMTLDRLVYGLEEIL